MFISKYFRVEFPDDRYISDEFYDLFSRFFEKDPFLRITTPELKKHPWLNKGRTPLSNIKSEKVNVTEEDMKSSLNFFATIQMAVIILLLIIEKMCIDLEEKVSTFIFKEKLRKPEKGVN
jgi:serine/threonine protein kinase